MAPRTDVPLERLGLLEMMVMYLREKTKVVAQFYLLQTQRSGKKKESGDAPGTRAEEYLFPNFLGVEY